MWDLHEKGAGSQIPGNKIQAPRLQEFQNNTAVPSDGYAYNSRLLAQTVKEPQASDHPETRVSGELSSHANPQADRWKAIHPSFLMSFQEQKGWHSLIMLLDTDLQSIQSL